MTKKDYVKAAKIVVQFSQALDAGRKVSGRSFC